MFNIILQFWLVQHGVWIHFTQLQQVLDVDDSVFPSRFGGCSACSHLTTCSSNNLEKQNLTGVGGLIIVWHLLPTCILRAHFCVHRFYFLSFLLHNSSVYILEQFHVVASSMLWKLASSLQIACCYKVPAVHHLFPISRTVDVDATIGDSGTSIMVLDIGTEVVNFRALVCGQTACHPLALAAWLFPFQSFSFLITSFYRGVMSTKAWNMLQSLVWNMMLTRINMLSGGDIWSNSFLCTDQVRMGNFNRWCCL